MTIIPWNGHSGSFLQLVPNTKSIVIIRKEGQGFICLRTRMIEQVFLILPDIVHSTSNSLEMEMELLQSLPVGLHELTSLSECCVIWSWEDINLSQDYQVGEGLGLPLASSLFQYRKVGLKQYGWFKWILQSMVTERDREWSFCPRASLLIWRWKWVWIILDLSFLKIVL